ncbi:MAG: ribosome small subunit-dependent GTPase A [Spirochaetota bacterium]
METIWNTIEHDVYLQNLRRETDDGSRIGRIIAQDGPLFELATKDDTYYTRPTGRLGHLIDLGTAPVPAVGDYVELADGANAPFHAILPRRTVYERKEAGERSQAQVICANVDLALIVTTAPPEAARDDAGRTLLHDFSVRRVERFIATLDSRVRPVVVINKCDLIDDTDRVLRAIESELPGTEVRLISALTGLGVDLLREEIGPGETAVLVGSSGSGKSTLIARLTGDEVRTGGLREADGRGRHTTTGRRMYEVPGERLLVDTPGVREVQLWAGEDAEQLAEAFPEIDELASACRFSDCRHQNEPGCAIRDAVARGEVTHERYLSYLELQAESDAITARREKRERLNERRTARKSRMKRRSRGS